MSLDRRSGCPINLSLEVFGDRWSLIILRDMIFGGRRHFRELLNGSMEGIASNILADRLKRLMELGMLTRADDPSHKQKAIYSLTEMAITLVPILAHLGAWGRVWLPTSEELSIRAELLEKGGTPLWEKFMDELRHEHLGAPLDAASGPTVRATLQAAYEAVVASRARSAGKASSASPAA
ncbi:winged helix-turn-helix transcriptional regulator [Mesorhizobium erdmanii]|uniref:winged helix-turn-helix transcriptional regulator n=1 Tax=Mesorhizobium erdmanii TaxID=1777866 RepID=UPI0003F59670|nr:helix-turn-helix domain-containing protein [Mesorhizobium erdmanii]